MGNQRRSNESRPIHDTVRESTFLSPGQAYQQERESHVNEGTYDNLKVYRWPSKNEIIGITCDVGGGNPNSKDGDYSTMGVFVLNELDRDELTMTWRGHINPIAFGEVACALAWAIRRIVGDDNTAPELIPEWTGPGVGMCTYIDQKNLYPNLYRYQVPGIVGMPKTKHVGWESNAKTTPMAVGHMLRMVERDLIDIPDELLVREMSAYRQTDSFGDEGSFNGASGRHDDMVSMFRIGCAWLRLRSKTVPMFESPTTVGDDYDFDPEGDLQPFSPFESIDHPMPGSNGNLFNEDQGEEWERWSM